MVGRLPLHTQHLPLKAMGWLVSVRISPFCRTVFCLFARPISATGEFSTSARAQLQGFKKLQGTTGRPEKPAKNSLKNKKLRAFF